MIRSDITKAKGWFTGEVKSLDYEVLQENHLTPLNVVSMTFTWFLKAAEGDADASALLSKTGASVTIVGVYDSDRLANTQRVRVAIAAADTRAMTGWTIQNGLTYWHELKRTDTETVITHGTAVLQQSLHRSAP